MPAALASLLTIALVGGCTTGSPEGDESTTSEDGTRTTVSMTEVTGTNVLRPKSDLVGSWDTIVRGDRATVITEITGSDGSPAQLFAVDPRSAKRTRLGVSAPLGWDTAVNDSVAVVAGDRTDDGSAAPFVRISSDLTSWQEVKVSFPDAGWRYAGVGLDGDTPLLFAAEPDGTTLVARVDDGSPTFHELPAADGQEIGVIDLVEHDGTLVLLHTEGAHGDETVSRVMTSDDGGRTWQRRRALPGKRGTYGVAGAVSTGTHLVATGWADREAPLGTRGMVWTSDDARTWKRKGVIGISWAENLKSHFADFHLTAPTAIDDRAVFDQTCGVCTWTTRFETTGEDAPEVTDNQIRIDAAGPSTDQLPGSSAGVRREGGTLRRFEGKHLKDLVAGDVRTRITGVEGLGEATLVPVGRFRFTRGEGENVWHTSTHITPHVLDPDLTQAAWQPAALNEWSGLATATDEKNGTTVAVGTRYSEKNGFRAAGRTRTDGSWSTPTGLGRHPYESVGDVTHVRGDFLLDLAVAQDGSTAPRTARIYSSADGTSWNPDEGTWTRGSGAESQIHDVCQLPDGSAFAVGASQADGNARWEATTWTRKKTSWNLDVPTIEGDGAQFDSCATAGDTTVVSGSLGGDDIEWTTTDGRQFTPSDPLPRSVSRGTAHEIAGGLVAAGYLDTADHLGPVVWYSTDGTTWEWAPIEVDDASASAWVETVDDDVYVVTSQSSGDRLWTIDEIGTREVTGDDG